jgi:DHA2 family multidrug resistance protein-like MFS transporter
VTGTRTAAAAGRREWLGLAVLTLPALLVSMDLTVLHLAVPAITGDLRPSGTQQLWIIDVYGFLIAGLLMTMGSLGDRIGRRRLLLVGAAGFGVASLVAAFATSATMLLAARAALGIAGATLAPSTLALIRTMFEDPGQRARAISVWFTGFLAGAALGPVVGGALLEVFWWGSVFLIGAPVMALLVVAGPRLLPETRALGAGPVDLPSVATSLGGVLALVGGLKWLAADGLTASGSAALVLGVVLATLFLRRQRRLPTPLLDLGLLGDRVVGTSLMVLTMAPLAMAGMQYLLAQHLQLTMGLSPLRAGLWLLPPTVVGVVAMQAAPRLVRTLPAGRLIGVSLTLAATGFMIVGLAVLTRSPVAMPGLGIAFAGLMPAASFAIGAVVEAVPPARAGAAAGLSETTQEVGGALGIAVLGSLGAAVYRTGVEAAALPGVPPEVAGVARDSLAGATAADRPLPADFLVLAREAFTQGLVTAAWAVSVALVVTAVLASRALSRDPTPSGDRGTT